jgi:hypothetical protein
MKSGIVTRKKINNTFKLSFFKRYDFDNIKLIAKYNIFKLYIATIVINQNPIKFTIDRFLISYNRYNITFPEFWREFISSFWSKLFNYFRKN